MALDLSKRQIAMLAEMGVRVWDAPKTRMPVVGSDAAAQHEPRVEQIEPGTWQRLEAAVRSCRACGLCGQRSSAWAPQQARAASWMVVTDMPAGPGAMHGDEEMLLDRIFLAVGRRRTGEGEQGVYVTTAVKCRPSGGSAPGEAAIEACREHLRREVGLLQPRMILGMGRFAARALLTSQQPLGVLRGRGHWFEGVPVVVTYPVAYLVRHPQEKAKAWADLCLAADIDMKASKSRGES